MTPRHVTSHNTTPCHVTSRHITSHHITSHHVTLHLISYHIKFHTTSHTSRLVVSHQVKSYRVIWLWYNLTCLLNFSNFTSIILHNTSTTAHLQLKRSLCQTNFTWTSSWYQHLCEHINTCVNISLSFPPKFTSRFSTRFSQGEMCIHHLARENRPCGHCN